MFSIVSYMRTAHLLDINRNMIIDDVKEGPVQSHDPDGGFGNTMMMVKRFTRQIKDTIKKHCIQKNITMERIFGIIEDD